MLDTPAIRVAVEGLYEAFSAYELREYTDPCLHCHTIEDETSLHAKPLRALVAADLRQYADDALLVWGGIEDFKHFLPRICEIFCEDQSGVFVTAPHILFCKLRYAKWHTWPESEQEAVRQFLMAIWASFLGDPPDEEAWTQPFDEPDDVACSIAQCEDEMSPYLNVWIEDQRFSSSLALSAFILTSEIRTRSEPVADSFWGDRSAQYAQVRQWLRSPDVEAKLLEAEKQAIGTELEAEFRAARLACHEDPG